MKNGGQEIRDSELGIRLSVQGFLKGITTK